MGYRIYKQPASVIYHAAQGDKSSIERIINAYDDYMNVKLCQEINENRSFTFSKEDIKQEIQVEAISAIKRFDVDVAIRKMKKDDVSVTFGDDYGN